MRNLNKKQNLVEQARIKLDEEKIAHSITQVRVKELESIIKEVREYINENVAVYAFNSKKLPHWEFDDDNINDILEILDKVGEE